MTNQEFAQKEAQTKKKAGVITCVVFVAFGATFMFNTTSKTTVQSSLVAGHSASSTEHDPSLTRSTPQSSKQTPTVATAQKESPAKASKSNKALSKNDANDKSIDATRTIRLHSRMLNSLDAAKK